MTNDARITLTAVDRTAQGLASARAGLTGLDRHVSMLSGGYTNLAAKLGGIFGAGALMAGAVSFGKSLIDAADRLDEMSERTGVAVESLAGLEHVMLMNGGTVDQLETSLKKLNIALSQAAAGDKAKTAIFDALGVKSRDAETAILELAAAFPRLSVADRQRIGMELLGKSGDALATAMGQGKEAMAALIAEGQRLNPVTSDAAKAAGELKDNWDKAKGAMNGVGVEIMNDLIPALNDVAIFTRKAQEEYGAFIGLLVGAVGGSTIKAFGADLSTAAGEVEIAERKVSEAFKRLAEAREGAARVASSDFSWMVSEDTKRKSREALSEMESDLKRLIKRRDELSASAASAKPSGSPLSLEDASGNTEKKISDYERWKTQIALVGAQLSAAAGAEGKLTASEGKLVELRVALAAGTVKMTAAEQANTEARLRANIETERAADSAKKAADLYKEQQDEQQRLMREAAGLEEARNQKEADRLQALLAAGPAAQEADRVRDIEFLNEKLDAGIISAERYRDAVYGIMGVDPNKPVSNEKQGIAEFIEQMQAAGNSSALFAETIRGAFDRSSDALADFVTTGKLDFQEFTRSLIADMAKMLARKALMDAAFGTGKNGNNGAVGAIGTALSSYFSSYHTGGIVGSGEGGSRMVSPSVFASAPRYHSGGLAGDEVAAILQKGEGVFTERQMRALAPAGSGGNVIHFAPAITVSGAASPAEGQRQARQIAEENRRMMEDVINKKLANEQRSRGRLRA